MDKMKSLFLSSLLVVVSTSGLAQNPIIQTNYTADPAPMVYNDKVYLYTTHDEDNSTWFTMNDWRLGVVGSWMKVCGMRAPSPPGPALSM